MTKRLQRLSRQLDEAIEFAIDLGKRYDAPSMCSPLASSSSVHYPSLYIDREDDSLDDLPDEGKATIHYKVKSRTKSEYDGKKSRSVSVDVMSIEPEEDEDDEGETKQRLEAINDRLNEFFSRDVMEIYPILHHPISPNPAINRQRLAGTLREARNSIGVMRNRAWNAKMIGGAGLGAGAAIGTVGGLLRKPKEGESRVGNAAKGLLKGAAVGGLAGAATGAIFRPGKSLAGSILKDFREASKSRPYYQKHESILDGLNEFESYPAGFDPSTPDLNRKMWADKIRAVRPHLRNMRGAAWNAKAVGSVGAGSGAAVGTIGGLLRKPKEGESRIGNAAKGLLKGAVIGGLTGAATGAIFKPGAGLGKFMSKYSRAMTKRSPAFRKFQALADHLTEFMDRTRDDMGRFQANQTGGIDPLTVKQAYPKKPSMLRTAGLVAAGAGAAKFGPGMIRSARKAIQNRAGLATGKVATVKAARQRQRETSYDPT